MLTRSQRRRVKAICRRIDRETTMPTWEGESKRQVKNACKKSVKEGRESSFKTGTLIFSSQQRSGFVWGKTWMMKQHG